jgi:hypothetical protein
MTLRRRHATVSKHACCLWPHTTLAVLKPTTTAISLHFSASSAAVSRLRFGCLGGDQGAVEVRPIFASGGDAVMAHGTQSGDPDIQPGEESGRNGVQENGTPTSSVRLPSGPRVFLSTKWIILVCAVGAGTAGAWYWSYSSIRESTHDRIHFRRGSTQAWGCPSAAAAGVWQGL